MHELHFNVKKVIIISLKGEYKTDDYVWEERTRIKRFLGKFRTPKYKEAGWYPRGCTSSEAPYTEKELNEKNYLIRGKELWMKTRVYVCLEGKNSFARYFDTLSDASTWINTISLHGTFEVVVS